MSKVSSEQLAVGLLFVAISVLACLAPTQSDTWWHLRSGQDTLANAFPTLRDTYSHTVFGRYWPNLEWLGEVVFYGLFRVGGSVLLTAGCALVMVATWALCWRLTRGPFELRFPIFAAAIATAAAGWAIRPLEFSLAAFVVTCWLLVRNRLVWLPILFVLWVNLHGGVVLGVAAVGAAAFAVLLQERRMPRPLVLTTLGCGLATVASPMGWRLLPEVFASLQRSHLSQLSEWQPPGFAGFLWPFWAVAAVLVVATVVRIRRLDRRTAILVGIAVAMLPLAVRSVRNVPVFLLAGVPALTSVLTSSGWKERPPRLTGERFGINATLLGIAGVLGAVFVALSWRASLPSLGWRPISPQAIRAISTCGQPMYNTYGEGGVLIWFVRQQPVFIDNRLDPYPSELLAANHALELSGDYAVTFARYQIACAVVPPDSATSSRLEQNPAWSKSFADSRWAVFRKRLR